MGQWDAKNFKLEILVKENLTDPRVVEFVKGWNFTIKEERAFFKSFVPYNSTAEKIVRFFVDYKDGMLMPDKYDNREPLRMQFDPDKISDVVRIVSFNGDEVYLKKKRKYDATITNTFYSLIFDEKGNVIPPKRVLGDYGGKVNFSFSKQSKPDMVFLKQLLRDFAEYIGSDVACIWDMETFKVIYDLYHPENNGMNKRDWLVHYRYWFPPEFWWRKEE